MTCITLFICNRPGLTTPSTPKIGVDELYAVALFQNCRAIALRKDKTVVALNNQVCTFFLLHGDQTGDRCTCRYLFPESVHYNLYLAFGFLSCQLSMFLVLKGAYLS